MDDRDIIFSYFQGLNKMTEELYSLMRALSTDELVRWFVDEGYSDGLEKSERAHIIVYYQKHCY